MVKNTIKVYGRIKRSNKSFNRNFDIRQIRDFHEINFNHDSSGDYGYHKHAKHRYRFVTIFDESSTQSDVFDAIAKPVVNSVLEGYNGTIFAYGQTGSGKTYSMTGSAEYETRGIIPRTIQHVFQHVENSTSILYNVYISYLEIYNEIGYDLLNPRHRATYLEDLPRVTILEDAKGQTHLRNLGVISVASEREAMCLLFLGDTNRTIAETPMNMYSSRSHCIFTVHVAATMTEDGRVRRSKLHLVDLAGSERVNKTGISGTLLVDAKQINLSLHYLEQVIIALSDEKRIHVPYRNSLMTSVLKDSLGGNCLTAMLATLSADNKNFDETISTCKFAQRVALISSEVYIIEEEDPEVRISQLKLEIENLKKELAHYKNPNNSQYQINEKRELTPEQIEECENRVYNYIQNASDNFPMEDDYINKISTYFKIFKHIIISQCQTTDSETPEINQPITQMIKQKDNEISILVHLLDKEKLKTIDTERNSPLLKESCPDISANFTTEINEKKALEIFMRKDNKSELNRCATSLKEKITQAKNVSDNIKMCKNIIRKRIQCSTTKTAAVSLKVKLRENINSSPEVANKLMAQLKNQQDIYRETIMQLSNIKTETDHLSHAFQQEKLRTMKRFKIWCANEKLKFPSQKISSAPAFTEDPISQEDSGLFMQNTFNEFSGNYQTQDQYGPELTSGNNGGNFKIDTFPSFYENEPNNYESQLDDLRITSEQNFNQQFEYRTSSPIYKNKYKYTETSSNYMQSNLNDFQSFENETNSQNQASSSNKMKERFAFKNTSKKYDSYPKTKSRDSPFIPISQVINQYSGRHTNIRYHYSIPPNEPSFSLQTNNYEQPNYIDYDIPERLKSESKRSNRFLAEGNSYCNYPNNEISTEQIETQSENIHSLETIISSTSNAKHISTENKKSPELSSIPLTGDPEVDEEILAFYHAKNYIYKSSK